MAAALPVTWKEPEDRPAFYIMFAVAVANTGQELIQVPTIYPDDLTSGLFVCRRGTENPVSAFSS